MSLGVISAFSVVNRQFPHRHMAAVLGALGTYASGGPLIWTTLYYGLFHQGPSYEQQNIRGYFLSLASCSVLIHVAAVITYGFPTIVDAGPVGDKMYLLISKKTKHDHEKLNDTNKLKENHNCNTAETNTENIPDRTIDCQHGIIDLLRDPRFHLSVWPSGFIASVKYLGSNNLSAFLRSFNFSQYEILLSYIPPITLLIIKPILGVVSDMTSPYFSRAWYLLTSAILQLLLFILSIFYLDHVVVFAVVLVFWTIGSELACLQLVLYEDVFGKSNFSFNVSILVGSVAGFSFLGQAIFGISYSSKTPRTGYAGACFGLNCFVMTFVSYVVVITPCIVTFMAYIKLNHVKQTTTE